MALQVQVHHGGLQVAVAQKLFNGVNINAGIEQMRGPARRDAAVCGDCNRF